MGSYYLVKKHIKKNYYWYYQTTWREGSKVKCHCIYVGPVSKIARPLARRGLASSAKESMNGGMHNQYPGDPAAEGRAAVMRDYHESMKRKTLKQGIGGPLDLHENHTFSNACPTCMNEDSVELTERELRQMNIGDIDKNITEKGYYEQPLEQKQAFCKKTGGHRDFIIGEQKEIDGQLRTEHKCGWCGTIEHR